MKLKVVVPALVVSALSLSGCAKQEKVQESVVESGTSNTAAVAYSTKSSPPVPLTAFDSVEKALQAGDYDTAAAQLLGMRASGKQFTEVESAQYRQLLNDAYMQALEPAQKGDARAKAAIEMIRANPGR